ncbi:MAG: prolipoprotein diacylglyceryl transferase [Alphaproteobacteria bacterium]|nr:MAG: prolipoprotein diacylglyceryl transferase [Alphaproteobacteria bacterium]
MDSLIAAVLSYPDIDPVIIAWGPIAIRWYSMAYILGLILGWAYMRLLIRTPDPDTRSPVCRPEDVDDFVLWAMVAVVLGGRLGYVLFYNFGFYAENPAAAFRLWDGGMSFHGGLAGVAIALVWFARRRNIPLFQFTDRIACVAPIGLFLGRVANFINGELYGRVTDAPWGMVFPGGGPLPRHPSQLYEASLEGLALLIVLSLLFFRTRIRQLPGVLTGLFLVGYALARTVVEVFREPDAHIGFVVAGLTMGQLLSIPVALFGLYLAVRPVISSRSARR